MTADRGAEWLDQRGAGEPPASLALTDDGNALRLIAQHGQDLRYVAVWGWMVWTGTHWARDERDLQAAARMQQTARRIHAEAAEAPDTKTQREITKWALASQQAQRIREALWMARPAVVARPSDFDQAVWLLPCANGTVDLRTGERLPHRREDLATQASSVVYDPEASAPTWLRFLERVLPSPELRAFAQRLAGYCLTGSTAEQKLCFLYGHGCNGKSLFLETLGAILGDYYAPARIESFAVRRHMDTGSNDIASLAGRRLVAVSETPQGVRLNEALVKDLTGGDKITARFLYHESFSFVPQFKLLIRGNHKPQIRGTDEGIWRRVLLLPFTVRIPDEEIDPNLGEKLRAELPGVLAWAVAGALEWQRLGLAPPPGVTQAVKEYREEMDILGDFIDEACVRAPTARVQSTALYKAYRAWCESNGERAVGRHRFGEALAERGFTKMKSSEIWWCGIGLHANRELPDQ